MIVDIYLVEHSLDANVSEVACEDCQGGLVRDHRVSAGEQDEQLLAFPPHRATELAHEGPLREGHLLVAPSMISSTSSRILASS